MRVDEDNLRLFLHFVHQRHQVWVARQQGQRPPWSSDPIVRSKKFCNAFRVLDYGSQFVVEDLIEPGLDPGDLLMRLFLYRHTGIVEPWFQLHLQLGEYPRRDNLKKVGEFWREYRATAPAFFTRAYLVYPQSTSRGTNKLEAILDLTRRLFVDGDVAEQFLEAQDQQQRFQVLRSNKGVGDFMSMQTLTDYGYSTTFREDEFVVAGPGSRRGAALLSPNHPPEEVIRWMHRFLAVEEDAPQLTAPSGATLRLSLMDVQNCFCEFNKYVRYLGRYKELPVEKRPEKFRPYKAAHWAAPPRLPALW